MHFSVDVETIKSAPDEVKAWFGSLLTGEVAKTEAKADKPTTVPKNAKKAKEEAKKETPKDDDDLFGDGGGTSVEPPVTLQELTKLGRDLVKDPDAKGKLKEYLAKNKWANFAEIPEAKRFEVKSDILAFSAVA